MYNNLILALVNKTIVWHTHSTPSPLPMEGGPHSHISRDCPRIPSTSIKFPLALALADLNYIFSIS